MITIQRCDTYRISNRITNYKKGFPEKGISYTLCMDIASKTSWVSPISRIQSLIETHVYDNNVRIFIEDHVYDND